MPMEIESAPATYQRLIDHVLKDLQAFIYHDEIVIYSETLEEHDVKARGILYRCRGPT